MGNNAIVILIRWLKIHNMEILKKSFCFLLLLALSAGLYAADRSEKSKAMSSSAFRPEEGDFLPDTVNVFNIAKDVSQIFLNAINTPAFNDVNGDPVLLNQIFNANYTSNDVGQAYLDAIEDQIKAQQGDIGLNFRSDYTENFTPGLSVEEDLTYKRRFYVGLEWDIIKGGLFDAGNKVHQLKMQSILKEYDAMENAEKENYRYLFNYVNYIFNAQKIEILNERKVLVKKQLQFTKELYHLRYVGWEKVLDYQAKLEDIDQQVFQFENFNKYISVNIPDTLLAQSLSAKQLPLFDVNLDSLMGIYYRHHSVDTVTQVKLAIYKDNLKWWKDITLKPFVRYNMYVNDVNVYKNYGSAGVNLSVPLRFYNKEKLIRSQEVIYQSEQSKELEAGDNEMVNIYAEFGFKVKQIKDFYYKKMNIDELIRKELVKKEYRDVAFNPVYTLGLIDEKKAIEGEIIDIKKRMYINLVRLAFYLEDRTPTNFITVIKPEDFTGRYEGSVKMFVKKDDILKHSAMGVVNYLWKNEFVDAIVESDSIAISDDLKIMIDKSGLANIFYTIMRNVPNNGQYPDVLADVNKIISLENSHIIGIHYELDLLNNQDTINEVSEVLLSDWISSIPSDVINGKVRISLGIPSGLSASLLNNIFDKFDLVFVHENRIPNVDRVKSDYETELNIDKDKFVISLKGTDFVDRMHLENYMANLYENVDINNFAFSDYSSMMDVDFKTFEKGNEINLQPGELVASIRDQIYSSEEKSYPSEKIEIVSNQNDILNQQIVKPLEQTRIESSPVDLTTETKLFRIQIAASKVQLKESRLQEFKAENIREILKDGYYKYTIGSYQSEKEALSELKTYKSNSGNSGAFIVTY